MKKILQIPQSVCSSYEGFSKLVDILRYYSDKSVFDQVSLDFRNNQWFDANLLPVIYAIVEYGKHKNIASTYTYDPSSKLHHLLLRNGFANHCFGLPYQPFNQETTISFKKFQANDTYGFAAYIDAELLQYFPCMDMQIKKDLLVDIFRNYLVMHIYTVAVLMFLHVGNTILKNRRLILLL